MVMIYVFAAIIWILFLFYWGVSAITAKRSRVRLGWKGAVIRLAVFATLFMLIRAGFFDVASVTIHSVYLQCLGLALLLLGVSLAVWARVFIGKNWGLSMSQVANRELVTSGPYHYVRHPIYSGFLLALIGTVLVTNLYVLIVLVIFGISLSHSAVVEERTLAKEFPKAYPKYKASSKMLVPFVL